MPRRRTFAEGILPSALSLPAALSASMPPLAAKAGSRGTGSPELNRYPPHLLSEPAARDAGSRSGEHGGEPEDVRLDACAMPSRDPEAEAPADGVVHRRLPKTAPIPSGWRGVTRRPGARIRSLSTSSRGGRARCGAPPRRCGRCGRCRWSRSPRRPRSWCGG